MCSIAGNSLLRLRRAMRCALCRAASPRKGVDLRDILARLCRCRDGRTSSCPVSCVCAGSVWRLFVSLAEGCCPLCTVRYDVGRWRPYVGADDPLSWNRTRASGRARAVRRNGRIVNLGSIARGAGFRAVPTTRRARLRSLSSPRRSQWRTPSAASR